MFVKPRFVQFLTSVSVAAMFIATPLAVKFDGAGGFTVVTAAAFAQSIPDDLPGGPVGPPPGCDGDCGPPTDPVDPPTDPVDPIDPPTDPVDPPTDPVDPPTDPVDPIDPPTEPVDPPTDPIDPAIDECDQKDAPDKCFEPEPAATPSPSDDDDDVPSKPPVADIPAETTPKQDGLEFVETLRCQTACTASVAADGDVTVTVTSTTPDGSPIKTTLTQDGPEVGTKVVLGSVGGDQIVITADENLGSDDAARDEIADRTGDIPEDIGVRISIAINVDFPDGAEGMQSNLDEIADAFLSAMSDVLDIPADRFQVTAVTEG